MRLSLFVPALVGLGVLPARGEEAVSPELEDLAAVGQPLEDADLWNYPNDNGFVYNSYLAVQALPDELPVQQVRGRGRGAGRGHRALRVPALELAAQGRRRDDEPRRRHGARAHQGGQPFYRCGVESIDSIAYAAGSNTEVGRVTAIYGKTRAGDGGPWVYGWTLHSHRARRSDGTYEPRVFLLTTCPSTGCWAAPGATVRWRSLPRSTSAPGVGTGMETGAPGASLPAGACRFSATQEGQTCGVMFGSSR